MPLHITVRIVGTQPPIPVVCVLIVMNQPARTTMSTIVSYVCRDREGCRGVSNITGYSVRHVEILGGVHRRRVVRAVPPCDQMRRVSGGVVVLIVRALLWTKLARTVHVAVVKHTFSD